VNRHRSSRTRALGVVLPVHNEEELLGEALSALGESFAALRDATILTQLVVVFDACRDNSPAVAQEWLERISRRNRLAVSAISCEANNVGFARELGCAVVLNYWRDIEPSSIWIATTDADSRVPRAWLRAQVRHHDAGVDVWAGRVSVHASAPHHRDMVSRWQREYEREREPIHGASLGFNAEKYLLVGGFPSLETGEDRALLRRLVESGAQAYFDQSHRVVTSARRGARAPHGFAETLHDFGFANGASAD
jgi:glycosyltransferase involved in cell wall biosynthesis